MGQKRFYAMQLVDRQQADSRNHAIKLLVAHDEKRR
jgi:hypothetical protein